MERIRELRERRGLSQDALADRAGISQQAIAHYEKGDRTPAADVLCNIADALGVESDYLLERSESPIRENRLPQVWVETVHRAVELGLTPRDVLEYVEFLGHQRRRGAEAEPSRQP